MLKRFPLRVLLLAGTMLTAGVLHVVMPRPFDSIIPQAFDESWRRPLTYASGAAELTVGTLMLIPRTRQLGGRLTAVLLLAVWPANIDAALNGGYRGLDGFAGSAAGAWLRVPLQIPLILWALWVARSHHNARAVAGPDTPTFHRQDTN